MDEKNNALQQQYINTPFAYTKFSKNLTLLQQSMLVKVSEYLQDYVKRYFGSDLSKSRDIPRPLFSEAEKNSGIAPIMVSYAELGVSLNNYHVAHEAVKEVLALTVDAPGLDKDNNPAIIKYNIFSDGNMSSDMSNGVLFSLNPKVVDYVFDMSQGYVRHPADIARIGQVERMPMMYYYLFKRSERWKNRTVNLTVMEIKDYLGMRSRVTEGTDERRGRNIKDGSIKEAYPKFSQFRKNVLDTSISDINRLRKEGLIDVCVRYEPVYNGKRKVGNPAFIRFCIYDTIEEMQMDIAPCEQELQFAADRPGEREWYSFIQEYDGIAADALKTFSVHRYEADVLFLSASSEQISAFENLLVNDKDEVRKFHDTLHKHFGKKIGIKYFIPQRG